MQAPDIGSKKQKRKMPQGNITLSVPTSNRYSVLSDNEIDMETDDEDLDIAKEKRGTCRGDDPTKIQKAKLVKNP
ncbi:hypothetical protein KM043_018795, partial [Ampulex compressa]